MRIIAIVTSLAVTGLCAALLVSSRTGVSVYWFGGWRPRHGVALGVSFAVDSFGAGAAMFVGVVTTVALIVAGPSRRFGPVAHALTLVLLAAATGFCLTGDLFNLFVFFELMSVCTIALCALNTGDLRALRGALQFAIANTIGAFFVLVGIALLYSRTGALNLASIGERLAAHQADQLVITALLFITVGFLIKAAIVPFHFWFPDAAAAAPSAVAMLLVGVLDTLGLYAVARIYWTVFAGTHAHLATLEPVLIGAGVATALLGAGMSLTEEHPPRKLAFVAISHSGLMLIAIGLLNPIGLAGFGLYAYGDGAIKASLFALDSPRAAAEPSTPGTWYRSRSSVALVVLAGLALAGMPPAVTFLAKGLTETGTSGFGRIALSGVVFVASALTGGAVIRLGLAQRSPRNERGAVGAVGARSPAARSSMLAALSLLLIAFGLGLVPGLGRASLEAATRFTDRRSYAATVLHGARPAAVRSGSPNPGFEAVALGVAAALGAAAVGASRPKRSSPEDVDRPLLNARLRPLRALHGLHTGRVGDSAAWITFGTAAIGAALAVGLR